MEKLKEKISIHKEERSHIWAGFLLVSGGTGALITDPDSLLKIILIIIGVILSILLFFAYMKKAEMIDGLMERVEE